MIIDIPGVSERRQTPRYEAKLALDMVLQNGNVVSVTTRNISSCGLQIICDTWVTDEIEPRGIQSHSVSHLRIKAITELPIAGENTSDDNNSIKKLYANCRIISVRRMSQDEYMLSLAFIDFENDSEKVLIDYLDQYTQKKTIINSIA
jgi:hypothetical protein